MISYDFFKIRTELASYVVGKYYTYPDSITGRFAVRRINYTAMNNSHIKLSVAL